MMEQTPPSQAALSSFAADATVAHEIAMRDGGERVDQDKEPSKAAISVDHVSDFSRRYPGEQITFFTRVTVRSAVPGFTVRVQVPAGLEIDSYQSSTEGAMPVFFTVMEPGARELVMLPGPDGDPFPVRVPGQPTRAIEPVRPAQDMVWRVLEPQEAGTSHEFSVSAVVLPIHQDAMYHSTATLAVVEGDDALEISTATASLAVYRGGRYLEYLPSLYEQDSFMGRFLMLFESFWAPIDQQISSIHNYFDPDLTPARFLPWLASWFDLTLDEFWNEDQQRELLNSVMWLYRRRGTRVALQRYLEIFTQEPVEILEKRAKNMTLGNKARLGVGVALGTGNMPHTFTVKLKLRPIPPPADLDAEGAAREVERLEKQRLSLINRMIVAEKPAHTSYRLEITEIPD
jgi:phage tail-like protein